MAGSARSACRRSMSTAWAGSPFRFCQSRASNLSRSQAAFFWAREAAVVDREVRRTWQVAPSSSGSEGHWDNTLTRPIADVARELGVSEPVASDFYKTLIDDTGRFFVDHRDTEKVRGSRPWCSCCLRTTVTANIVDPVLLFAVERAALSINVASRTMARGRKVRAGAGRAGAPYSSLLKT